MLKCILKHQKIRLAKNIQYSFGLFSNKVDVSKEMEEKQIPLEYKIYYENVNNFDLDYAQKTFKSKEEMEGLNENINFLIEKGFSKEMISKINKEYSKMLSQNTSKMDIKAFYEYLTQELQLSEAKCRRMLFKYPRLTKLSLEDFKKKVELIQSLNIKDKALGKVLTTNPLALNQHLENKIADFERIFHSYTRYDKTKLGKIISNFPFFLSFSGKRFEDHMKNLKKRHFSNEEVLSLVHLSSFSLQEIAISFALQQDL